MDDEDFYKELDGREITENRQEELLNEQTKDEKYYEDDDFLFNPQELNQLISRFMENSSSDEEKYDLLKQIEYNSSNSRAAYSLAKDIRGETTFIDYLLLSFSISFPIHLIPPMLHIFSNVMHIPGMHEFFFQRNMQDFFKAILKIENQLTYNEIKNFVKDEMNSRIVHELVIFISKLAEKTGSFDSIEEMVSFWQTFTIFLMCVIQEDDLYNLIDCFKAIMLIIKKHNNLRLTFLHNDIIHYCFRRFDHYQSDFTIVCKLLGSLVYCCDLSFHFFPNDWISIITDKLLSADPDSATSILDMLISFTSITDICIAIIESDFINTLLDFSQEATFSIRKNTLKVIMEVFIDGRDLMRFVDFLLHCTNLDFFMPFMETDDHEVVYTVLRPLVDIIDLTEVTIENGVPPLYSVFADSGDMMNTIEEITDFDVEEDDSDLEHDLVECANIILSKMISNREIAESL